MAFLDSKQLDAIQIDRMIFHVVGPEEDQLVLLEEIDPGDHSAFFLDRIKSVTDGIMFDFAKDSPVLKSLRAIGETKAKFAPETKDLARLFKSGHGGNTSLGVFMVFILSARRERFYALLKYDHETVLSYIIQKKKPLITELHNTFVKSPDALQKSAIVRLTKAGGELSVRDRVAPKTITQYFQAFLGAQRRFNPTQLTTKLTEVAKRVAKQHEAELGVQVLSGFNQRVYEVVQNQEGFDPSHKEPFLASVYGPLPPESNVRTDFDRELRKERIEDENFQFDREAVQPSAKKHLVTAEGVELIWNRPYHGNIKKRRVGY